MPCSSVSVPLELKKHCRIPCPFPTLHKLSDESHLPGFFIVFMKDLLMPMCKVLVSSQGTQGNPLDRLNTAQFLFHAPQLLQNHVYQRQSRQPASTHVLLSFSLVYLSIQSLLITWTPETQEYPFGARISHNVGKLSVIRASDNKTQHTEKPLGILDQHKVIFCSISVM